MEYQDWQLIINNLNDNPVSFEKLMSELQVENEADGLNHQRHFLYAKICENYPFDKCSHHEQFDKAVLKQALNAYNHAISLCPDPLYLLHRSKFLKYNGWVADEYCYLK